MEIRDYLENMKLLEEVLLKFFNDLEIEENFQNFVSIINNHKIKEDKYELKTLLYLISSVMNNHCHSPLFFSKIESLLLELKNEMIKYFTCHEIFNIFSSNKKILLFLFKEKILNINESMIRNLKSEKYEHGNYISYFSPEIKKVDQILSNFDEKRLIGENDNLICLLIRNDSIDEFIAYINHENIKLTASIEPSIFETNLFLNQNGSTLIEYAAFFGSMNIFKYLLVNGAEVKPNIWIYAIHSNNIEFIHFLEQSNIELDDKIYNECFLESIKCHHNDIASYIQSNLLTNLNNLQNSFGIKYYNFMFFPCDFNEDSTFYDLIEYDYYSLISILLNSKKIDIEKYFVFSKEKKQNEITDLLRSFLTEDITNENQKLKSFLIWEQDEDGKIQLTKEAFNMISSSNHPCIILQFGFPRIGKSTISSHLASGPANNISYTVFKTAASADSCTHFIHGVGPIKCRKLASNFGIDLEDENNKYLDRDIFFIDSEGLNSFDGETAWLKQAIISMLPFCTISFYVSSSLNKVELDYYMKYLNLTRVIGGIEIHHGLGYIYNFARFDGTNIMNQVINQNEKKTKSLIEDFEKTSFKTDDSHFKCFSILDFSRHKKEYFQSLAEVAKFIIDLCLKEGMVMTGKMVVKMLNEMIEKTSEISSINDLDCSFETLFLQILEKSMVCSIKDQIPQIENEIREEFTEIPLQKLNLLDINSYMNEVEKNGLVDQVINNAIQKTLPDIPSSFPLIVDTSRANAINIIKDIAIKERYKIIEKGALEVHDLGYGFSIIEGTIKKKVLDLNFQSKLVEKKLNEDVFVVFHLPEFAIMKLVPIGFQKYKSNNYSSFDDYISSIDSGLRGNGSIGFNSSKLSLSRASNLTQNLLGFSFSNYSPEKNFSTSVSVNSLAQIYFDPDIDLSQYFNSHLKNLLIDLEKILSSNDIKSPEVKQIISNIYSMYGESVAIGFFVGCYEIDISHDEGINIESGGYGAFSSNSSSSKGIKFLGLKFGKTESNQKSEQISTESKIISDSKDHTKIVYGSPLQPSTFMFDIAEGSSFGSSFVPFFKLIKTASVSEALEYWAGRWNINPETYSEYCFVNDISHIPIDTIFKLYYKNRPYDVKITKDNKIAIPDAKIEYLGSYSCCYDVILDPKTMTISGFENDSYVIEKNWKKPWPHKGTRHRTTINNLSVTLGPFWEFDQEITAAYFTGNGVKYMHIIDPNPHSFKVKFQDYPLGTGKNYEVKYSASLQTSLKVRLS